MLRAESDVAPLFLFFAGGSPAWLRARGRASEAKEKSCQLAARPSVSANPLGARGCLTAATARRTIYRAEPEAQARRGRDETHRRDDCANSEIGRVAVKKKV